MLVTFTQAPSSDAYDVYSRVFAPAVGILEDPVVRQPVPPSLASHILTGCCSLSLKTGAAHTAIAPYWLGTPARTRLGPRFASREETTIRARQVSARGGDLDVTWNRAAGRVELVGEAITMMTGTVNV
jgi:predicted PhzF superfamily epimerase YddE/YHI9